MDDGLVAIGSAEMLKSSGTHLCTDLSECVQE